jgi:hypothetical protein
MKAGNGTGGGGGITAKIARATPSESPVRMSVGGRSFKEITTAQDAVPKAGSPRKTLPVAPTYEAKSLANDIIDPIYENVDPIGVTNKARLAEGSPAAQVSGRKE